MKDKLRKLCLLPVAVTLAAAQAQTAPPVKMGLWKTSSTITTSGFELPPDVAARMKAMGRSPGQPHTANTLSCLTAEKWKKIFDPAQHDQKCQFTNQQQSSSGMSADMACSSGGGAHTSTGHMAMTFDSKEKMHGKFHMEVNSQSQPHPILIDNSCTSHPIRQSFFPSAARLIRAAPGTILGDM
jgi:Protein of unknown function (DUF3617)